MLKTDEISKLSAKEVDAKVASLKAELFSKKLTKFTTGTEKPHVAKELKKDIVIDFLNLTGYLPLSKLSHGYGHTICLETKCVKNHKYLKYTIAETG